MPTANQYSKTYHSMLSCTAAYAVSEPSSPPSKKQHDQPAALHGAWQVLLQQPVIANDFYLICSLLSCSNSIYRAATPSTIDLQYVLAPELASKRVHQFSAWLARYGSILRQLQPDSSRWVRKYGMSAAESAITAGFRAAAAGAPLRLQLYRSIIDGASNGDILLLLSPVHLRELHLHLHKDKDADVSRYTAALAGLTNLRSLSLAETVCTSDCSSSRSTASAEQDSSFIGQLLPALASLTQLTCLSIPAPKTAAEIQYLPVQLKRLAFTARYDLNEPGDQPCSIGLTHLTALTRLECFHSLRSADQLPQQLELIDVPTLGSIQPLLGLQKLQTIVLSVAGYCDIPVQKPAELEETQQLKHVDVKYRCIPGVIVTDFKICPAAQRV